MTALHCIISHSAAMWTSNYTSADKRWKCIANWNTLFKYILYIYYYT